MTNRPSTYQDLSPYFDYSRDARHSLAFALARFNGELFSIYAVIVDWMRMPQTVAWLNSYVTRGER